MVIRPRGCLVKILLIYVLSIPPFLEFATLNLTNSLNLFYQPSGRWLIRYYCN